MNLFSKLTAAAALSVSLGLAVPSISHAAVGDQELSQGMQNKDVAQLQDILENRGYLSHLETKGNYDAKTAEAVKEYQSDHHLNVDGIAGPNTFNAMNLKTTIGPEFLSKGNKGYDVTVIQNKLQELDYYNGKIDGLFGSKTKNALQGFQSDKGILSDGIAGPDTKSALGLKVVGNETAAKAVNKENEAAEESTQAASKTVDTAKKAAPQPQPKQKSEAKPKTEQTSNADVQGKTITVKSTAYTANCAGCSGITSTGINLNENSDAKVIAVDPSVIPLGSTVYVPGYGTAIAGDTGGAINGNRIDIFFASKGQADNWGVKTIQVKILK